MCVTMAQESVSSASMPGAAYGDDVARDIPEKELSPAESAFAGPARVADQCDPAETVILHAPVDAVMTYTWDARRGRNLHVAWPANIPELARHEPPRTDSARGGGITPFDRTRTPGDSILVVKRGAERAAYPKAANAALADTKEIEKIEKIEKTFTPALRSLRAPRFPTAQAREASVRWPQLLLRGQTHRRLNAFGPGVAPPGARLTGAPDWALEDDEDEDDTATVSADAPPRASVRVTHVARRDGEVVARQRRVREDAPSSRAERVESRNRTVARALRARATRGTQDGRLPGAEWRTAHRDALVAAGTRSRGMASAASEPAPVSFGVDANDGADMAPTERYGVEADLALGYGSASQPFSRSKAHVPGDSARRSTTRTFRDETEVARAVARVARARDSKAADAATLVDALHTPL